ncbi:hypothetical protein TSOC_014839, partial [Tetrabaena socialis]
VAAATCGAMVLFSSSTALMQLALMGRLNTHYAAVFGPAAIAASILGQQLVARAVKRSGRPSVVVLALACIMAAGLLSVGVFGVARALADLRAGHVGFTGLCTID